MIISSVNLPYVYEVSSKFMSSTGIFQHSLYLGYLTPVCSRSIRVHRGLIEEKNLPPKLCVSGGETDPIKGIMGSLLAWPTRGAHRSLHNPLQTEKKH